MSFRRHAAIVARLAEAGYTLPETPLPIAAYSPAVIAGSFAYTSGQLPLVNGKLALTGRVGDEEGDVSPRDAAEQAARCTLNALAALVAVLGDLSRITRVIKITGFVASSPDFTEQSSVVDGASRLLVTAFGDDGIHARSAVGVAALPKGSPVEVELVVQIADDSPSQ